jgi:hypothetical protein
MEQTTLATQASSNSKATRERVARAALSPLSTARDALSTVEERAVAELKRTERRAASARSQLERGVSQARKQAGRVLPF